MLDDSVSMLIWSWLLVSNPSIKIFLQDNQMGMDFQRLVKISLTAMFGSLPEKEVKMSLCKECYQTEAIEKNRIEFPSMKVSPFQSLNEVG